MKDHSFRESVDQGRSYLSKGFYAKQLEIWKKKILDDEIHILTTEDMKERPEEELSKIFKFLGIPKYKIPEPQERKMYDYDKMNSSIREELIEYYKPHNKKLFDLIGRKFEWDN